MAFAARKDPVERAKHPLVLMGLGDGVGIVEDHQRARREFRQHQLELSQRIGLGVRTIEKRQIHLRDLGQKRRQDLDARPHMLPHDPFEPRGPDVGPCDVRHVRIDFDGVQHPANTTVGKRLGQHDRRTAVVGAGFDHRVVTVRIQRTQRELIDQTPAGVADRGAAALPRLLEIAHARFQLTQPRIRQKRTIIVVHAVETGVFHGGTARRKARSLAAALQRFKPTDLSIPRSRR